MVGLLCNYFGTLSYIFLIFNEVLLLFPLSLFVTQGKTGFELLSHKS